MQKARRLLDAAASAPLSRRLEGMDMKPWIKRSFFGLAGTALMAGALGGCAAHRHGWGTADSADFRAKIVARVADKLELDAQQQAKLDALVQKLHAQRMAVRDAGGGGEPRSQFKALFAGNTLDRAGAQKLVDEKTTAVQAGSSEVIAAAADFYDGLNAAQQQKVREFMERRGQRWGRHG